ncbi:hypothetical protein PGT21_020692 [Puccinia graminis f. sp. tritici]|uniref:Uncharacterized protein n=1 Tax=Puccinia graminis f. sp. tritici TaxID=56615 RepID=A0A5B0RFN8_PUCGR|nr:hypothetical protein PGT21_020692 [Puccinia graminis f. sp. tritici]KAA1124560.1 hypothetical protein PGTUg99_016161 [Puccinia graminis f. sp. tritici]
MPHPNSTAQVTQSARNQANDLSSSRPAPPTMDPRREGQIIRPASPFGQPDIPTQTGSGAVPTGRNGTHHPGGIGNHRRPHWLVRITDPESSDGLSTTCDEAGNAVRHGRIVPHEVNPYEGKDLIPAEAGPNIPSSSGNPVGAEVGPNRPNARGTRRGVIITLHPPSHTHSNTPFSEGSVGPHSNPLRGHSPSRLACDAARQPLSKVASLAGRRAASDSICLDLNPYSYGFRSRHIP